MTVPSPRTPVKPARGYYAVVLNDVAAIAEGELVYIKDQNTLYVKEDGTLVPVLGNGSPATYGLQPGDNVTNLFNDAGYITLAQVPEDRVLSVNGRIGSVLLDADDIPTTGTVNKFLTQEEITKLAGIETGAQVNEVEEAPMDGNYYVRQNGQWVILPISGGGSNTVYDGGNFTTGQVDSSSSVIDGGEFS
jgi:hypothetical protein